MSEETYTITFTATQLHALILACDDSEEMTSEKIKNCPGDYDEEEILAMLEYMEECDQLSSCLIFTLFPHLTKTCWQPSNL